MPFDPIDLKLAEIFLPSAMRRIGAAKKHKTRLVHYTSASAARSILQNKEVWMRSTTRLNDISEISYGLRLLMDAYSSPVGLEFRKILNEIFPGITTQVETQFDSHKGSIVNGTFVACLTEQDDDPAKQEDEIGRLSMWRGYGTTTGVALVLSNNLFSLENISMPATSPVEYLTKAQFASKLMEVTQLIQTNREFLKNQNLEIIRNWIFHTLRHAIIGAKHPGFSEEREWRVVLTPSVEETPHVISDIQNVRGTPEKIWKIPLKDIPGQVAGLEIPVLLDRIIVGPTDSPNHMYEVFVHLLRNAGVSDAESRVYVSHIPLRV